AAPPAGQIALGPNGTCTWSRMYINAEYARAHDPPDAVVNPMLALCVAVGLSVEDLSEAGGPFLGVEDCVFHRPLYPGDTLTARSTVTATRTSESRPGAGIVPRHTEAPNQPAALVPECRRAHLGSHASP